MFIHSGGKCFSPVIQKGRSRQSDDGGPVIGVGLICPNDPCGLISIHHRHLHVHEDQIESLILTEFYCLLAVVGKFRIRRPALEDALDVALIHEGVLHDQEFELGEIHGSPRCSVRRTQLSTGISIRKLALEIKAECASLFCLTLHFNVPAVQFDQLFANGQAKARSPISLMGVPAFCLLEFLKNIGQLVLRNTNSGVHDLHLKQAGTVFFDLRIKVESDLAVVCELDRITDQVQEHLIQNISIQTHQLWNLVANEIIQLIAVFLRFHLHCTAHHDHRLMDVDQTRGEFHLPRFYLG